MKKQTVVVVWAVGILLAVVCGVAVYLRSSIKNTAKTTEEKAVFECVSSDIVGYSVKNKDYSYSIYKGDSGWAVKNSPVARLDEEKTVQLLKYASMILSNGSVKKSELSGFDKSNTASIKISLVNNKEYTINFLGTKGQDCAFSVSTGSDIYKTELSKTAALMPSLESLRVAEVFEKLSGLEKRLESFEYEKRGGARIALRVKQGDELAEGKNKFLLTEPYVWEADDEKVVQQITVNIPGLKKVRFLDGEAKNAALYGLDEKTRSTMSFTADKKRRTLYIGKNDGGIVYAMEEGGNDIFAISASQLAFLETEPFYLIDTKLVNSDVKLLSFAKLSVGNDNYEIKRQLSGEKTVFSINGADMNERAFNELAEAVTKLEITGTVKGKAQNKAEYKSAITLVADFGGTQLEVKFLPYEAKSYAVQIGGIERFTVDKDEIDTVVNKFKESVKNPIKAKKEKEGTN